MMKVIFLKMLPIVHITAKKRMQRTDWKLDRLSAFIPTKVKRSTYKAAHAQFA